MIFAVARDEAGRGTDRRGRQAEFLGSHLYKPNPEVIREMRDTFFCRRL